MTRLHQGSTCFTQVPDGTVGQEPPFALRAVFILAKCLQLSVKPATAFSSRALRSLLGVREMM